MRRTALLITAVLILATPAFLSATDDTPHTRVNDVIDFESDPFAAPRQSIGVSIAPTFSVGSAASYFSPGARLRFSYAMEFALEWALLRPGFSVGAQYMYAEGRVRSSHMLLVPVAAETSLVFMQDNTVQPAIALRAGASYLTLFPPSEEAVSKVLPYVGADGAVSFLRPNGMRLTGTIGLDLYAEATMLIWLITPGFQIEFSL
ncbi:MAG: hypothetical protein ACLFNT_03905 [Spirochaetales bacterium]